MQSVLVEDSETVTVEIAVSLVDLVNLAYQEDQRDRVDLVYFVN